MSVLKQIWLYSLWLLIYIICKLWAILKTLQDLVNNISITSIKLDLLILKPICQVSIYIMAKSSLPRPYPSIETWWIALWSAIRIIWIHVIISLKVSRIVINILKHPNRHITHDFFIIGLLQEFFFQILIKVSISILITLIITISVLIIIILLFLLFIIIIL